MHMNCPNCGAPMGPEETCHRCGYTTGADQRSTPRKKPAGCFTKILAAIGAFFLIVLAVGGLVGGQDSTGNPVAAPTNSASGEGTGAPSADAVPQEYRNALQKAEIYSDTMYMSKQGIYDQLVSEYGENFPAEAAQYAVDNLQADYNQNALNKAKIYYEDMAMSKQAVWDQLVSEYGEKFTEEQADYAIAHLAD